MPKLWKIETNGLTFLVFNGLGSEVFCNSFEEAAYLAQSLNEQEILGGSFNFVCEVGLILEGFATLTEIFSSNYYESLLY